MKPLTNTKMLITSVLLLLLSLLFVNNTYASETWLWPIAGTNGSNLSRGYSSGHGGIDICIAGIEGHDIRAAKSGTVIQSSNSCSHYNQYAKTGDEDPSHYCNGGCGNFVTIDHGDGTKSRYLHMQQGTAIALGTPVKRGDIIGKVGSSGQSSGPHCHFDIWVNGVKINNNPSNIDYDYSTVLTHDPIGNLDVVAGGAGTVYIKGWSYDEDDLSGSVPIHVYIGGDSSTAGAEKQGSGNIILANKSRPDLNENEYHKGVGNNHGFEETLKTSKVGSQEVYVYAINIGGGRENPLIGHATVTILPPDTTPPVISDVEVYPDYDGFTISCKVTDTSGIAVVKFPTWTAKVVDGKDQDDLFPDWETSERAFGTIWGDTVTYRVNRADHNYETGLYYTDIYAFDKAGNQTKYSLSFEFEQTPPIIENIMIDIDDTGYTITCDVYDESGISVVRFPTWTALNNQDDLDKNWWTTGSKSEGNYNVDTGKVTFRVNFADHNNERGLYLTDIYVYDNYGNLTKIEKDVMIQSETVLIATAEYNGHHYELYDNGCYYDWSSAMRFCSIKGGHLATVTSADENEVLQKLILDHGYYATFLGANDVEKEGAWKWITGEEWSYTNWQAGQPDNYNANEENQNYLRMYSFGTFDDTWLNDSFNNEYRTDCFICEYDFVNKYSVTYHLDGGSNSDTNPDEFTEFSLLMLEDPVKEHYTFKGWYLSKAGDERFQNGKTYSENLNLYARWEKTKYEITLDVNHEVDPDTELEGWKRSVTYGDPFGELPVPDWDGYTFIGWFTEKEGGVQIKEEEVYAGGTNFFAHWSQNAVQIVFDGNDIFSASLEEYTKELIPGQTYGTLPDISARGYDFLGWYTEKEGGTQITADTKITEKTNHALYAHWDAKEFIITFDINMEGMDNPSARKIKYNELFGDLPACAREGFTFLGWFDAADGTRKYTKASVYKSVTDTTLYAKWEKAEIPHTHTYESEVTTDSTCTETGVLTYTCTDCGDSYTEELPAKGHIAEDSRRGIMEASCTEEGYTGDIVCKYCQTVLEKGSVIPATGHQHTTLRDVKQVRCTEDGYTGDTWCIDCGAMIAEGTVINSSGHRWEKGDIIKEVTCSESGEQQYICSACGETKSEEIPAHGHLGNSIVRFIKGATCTTDGYSGDTYCSKCYELIKEGKVIPATGHHWDEGKITKEATCKEAGVRTYICLNDNNHTRTETILNTDHVAGDVKRENVEAATCEKEGSYDEVTYCTVCGTELSRNTVKIAALGHSYGGWEVIKAATYEEEGAEQRICTNDVSHVETRPIAKLQKPSQPEANLTPQTEPIITTPETESDIEKVPNEKQQEQAIIAQTNDSDPQNSQFGLLQANAVKVTKNSVTLKWKRVKGASRYIIYGNKCGKGNRYKRLKTVTGTSYTQKKLKKGTYYKYLVVAVGSGKALSTSKTIHVATTGGKYGNPIGVSVKKASVKLKVKKTYKIGASVRARGSVKTHRKIAYESTNVTIAKVDKNGKVTALRKGTCYIYAYAQNGVMSKVRITVK